MLGIIGKILGSKNKEKNQIDNNSRGIELKIPRHIGFIMDGNGRWAKKRQQPRSYGHKCGIDVVRGVIEECAKLGVECISFYAFSKENWSRPKDEVDFLMNAFNDYMVREKKFLIENKVKLKVIGDRNRLDLKLKNNILDLEKSIEDEVDKANIHVYLAISYSGQDEIIRSIKKMFKDIHDIDDEKEKIRKIESLDEKIFERYLDTDKFPKADLIIRTSGEMRISNFLMWQSAYSEFYFTKTLWPDFCKKDLMEAIEAYSKRDRRFGNIK